jgi:hypothetical protein
MLTFMGLTQTPDTFLPLVPKRKWNITPHGLIALHCPAAKAPEHTGRD